MLMVICTDCTGSCESNYYTITTTTAYSYLYKNFCITNLKRNYVCAPERFVHTAYQWHPIRDTNFIVLYIRFRPFVYLFLMTFRLFGISISYLLAFTYLLSKKRSKLNIYILQGVQHYCDYQFRFICILGIRIQFWEYQFSNISSFTVYL